MTLNPIIEERTPTIRSKAVHLVVRHCTLASMAQAQSTADFEKATEGWMTALTALGVTTEEISQAMTTEQLLYVEGVV